MATPFLVSLRQSTDADIWACGKPSAMHVYNGLDLFNRFVPYDGRSAVAFLDLVSSVRAGRFERGILLPHSFRSALLFFLGRVSERVGYDRNWRGMMLTRAVGEAPVRPEPTVEHYLRLLDLVGGQKSFETPVLKITDDEERRFDERFGDMAEGYIVFIVGAHYGPSKRWPDAYFSELADLLVDSLSTAIYLLPARGEEEIARRIREGARNREQVKIREMDVRELKVCLARASLVVANDTGPRHISSALSVPTVVILGPMDDRYTAYPSSFTHCMSKDIPCRPCNRKECDRDHECLRGIKPEEVFRKVEEVYGERRLRAN